MTPPSSPALGATLASLNPTTSRRWLGVAATDSAPEKLSQGNPRGFPLIVFSHLSWDWVWQRPQQFISRLSKRHRVLFVETFRSEIDATKVVLREVADYPHVTILEMHLPTARWDEGDFIDRERRRALKKTLEGKLKGLFVQPVLWFYDPMAVVAFAGQLGERALVYDCMDELSQFKGASPQLIERERELLLCADVVFCGGRKMQQKRLPLNSNCHFYGTGVDCAHFGGARSSSLKVAPEIAALGRPVLGYFGVIDERIDYELLAKLADARRDWSVAMVGPTTKVDPSTFPRRPNLHWLGPRSYADLPALTKGFAVCLMPFARNAATEYINPTKALEYMAAGRPVVSTALDEVRSNFGPVARIAATHDEFIALCAKESARPSTERIDRGLRLVAENTWEAIVAKMEGHIAEVIGAPNRVVAVAEPKLNPVKATRLGYV